MRTVGSSVAPARNALSPVRQALEAFVSLAVAVVIFRGFGLEGYLISTGSMAPTLLGYHHHVVCPDCHFEFDRGAPPPDDSPTLEAGHADLGSESRFLIQAHCPNCGRENIPLDQPRTTEGDQLLVQKHAYEFRDPRRWEVIVFRNPADSRQAYVKRLAGLPGEAIEVRDGEVFANGSLSRKPWITQLATRQVVSTAAVAQPDDPEWRERWLTESGSSGWQRPAGQWMFSADPAGARETDWLEYRHWIRSGGEHETRVSLEKLPRQLDASELLLGPLRYERGELIARGVLSQQELRWWQSRTPDPEFDAALEVLARLSHVAPITDLCDYNTAGDEEHAVDDLCLSLSLMDAATTGRLEISLRHGEREFRGVVKFDENRVELIADDSPAPLASLQLPLDWRQAPLRLDLSVIDDQVLLAVDEVPIAAPVVLPEAAPVPQRRPARVGASGGGCRIADLTLFRDVYYTPKGTADRVVILGDDQFFVLGDNSPVSLDSRAWDNPAVPRSALIGKPLVVHLPSRSGEIHWKGQSRTIRMPDLKRVRLIR